MSEGYISDIEFVNPSTGYAVAGYSGGDILKTTNAGVTWTSQITSYTLPIYGIAFTSEGTGYLAGSLSVYKTTNGGTNWTTIYTSTTNEIFSDIFFTNANTGYVIGSYGRLLKTTNAGANWVATTISGSGSFLSSIYFVNENTGYAVGDFNVAVKTTDAGATWTALMAGSAFVNHNAVWFTDQNTGYISSNDGIYKTTNAGASWFSTGAPAGGYSNVQFRGNFGYAITSGGKIIKSTDAGASWIVQPTVTENGLYGLYFNSDNFVYAGGLLGTMIKTIPTELRPSSTSGNILEVPEVVALHQNYPNPFNPTTTITFQVPQNAYTSLKVYDLLGREVAELINEAITPGTHAVPWNASDLASGMYFYRLEVGGFSETKRMMLLK